MYAYMEKGSGGTELNNKAIIYKQIHLLLFSDIMQAISEQYFSSSVYLFHIDITVKLFLVSILFHY